MNKCPPPNFLRDSQKSRALPAACVIGLLTLGLTSAAWAITGGQGGGGTAHGGAYGSGGQSGDGTGGSASSSGHGGSGGNSTVANGGAGGSAGVVVSTTTSVVTSVTGAAGGTGNQAVTVGNGGGGGGGGDGAYVNSGEGLTVSTGVLVSAGAGGQGGNGANGAFVGGAGGGGGSGVELGQQAALVNYGTITGGKGGAGANLSGSTGTYNSGGGGGGHGVVATGGNVTIANGGTITAGGAGDGGNGGKSGTVGDAILFNANGGFNNLGLLTGSTITGDIEAASGTLHLYARDPGLTLDSNILLDASNLLYATTNPTPLTISGVISGSGYLQVGPTSGGSVLTLTGNNTFTGGTTIFSGALIVNGSVGDVAVNSGASLGGSGTVGNVTLDQSGSIAPGGSPGTLHGTSLTWTGGGEIDFQVGAANNVTSTDLIVLSGALTKGNTTGSSAFKFHFGTGSGTPTQGTTYTLISFGSNSGFVADDFSFDTDGSFNACGKFSLTASALQFTVLSVSPDFIFCNGFE